MSDGKLGKRYIAVDHSGCVSTLLRDDASKHEAIGWAEKCAHGCDECPPGRVLVVDLDTAPIDGIDEYEDVERVFGAVYGRLQELRPDKRPDDVLAAELVRLREENRRMHGVVDAAIALHDTQDETIAIRQNLWNAIQWYRTGQFDRAGQPTTTAAVEPATLTPQECQLAIDALGFWSSDDNDAPHEDIDRLRDRLRRGSPAPRLTSADLARLRDAYLESVQAGPYQISSNMYTGDACAAYRELRRVLSDLNAAGKLGGEVGP